MHLHATLADHQIEQLIQKGVIDVPYARQQEKEHLSNVQPASMDLIVGKRAWVMKGSVKPRKGESLREGVIAKYAIKELDLTKGVTLYRGKVYVVELQESLSISDQLLVVRSNSKSSSGRSDIQTRLITDGNPHYDFIKGPFQGKLYLEIISHSFNCFLKIGTSLNQIRFSYGNSTMTDEETRVHSLAQNLVYHNDGRAMKQEEITFDGGVVLSIDLESPIAAYRAKKTEKILDLQKTDHNWKEFWEPLPTPKNKSLTIRPGDFYILTTKERVAIPAHLAAEVLQVDPKAGHFTSHYAGFFDPGFGTHAIPPLFGNTTTLEVRSHNREEILMDGQRVCVLKCERMAALPDSVYGAGRKSNYTQQTGPQLGKHYKR